MLYSMYADTVLHMMCSIVTVSTWLNILVLHHLYIPPPTQLPSLLRLVGGHLWRHWCHDVNMFRQWPGVSQLLQDQWAVSIPDYLSPSLLLLTCRELILKAADFFTSIAHTLVSFQTKCAKIKIGRQTFAIKFRGASKAINKCLN